jgi:predicted lipoprotein with Yx(FWY)xxD motif
MKGLLITGTAVVASVALAACGSGGGSTGGGSAAATGTKAVSVERIGSSGNVLVDAKGRALYTPDQEMSGKVLCTGACTSIWMPATVRGATASSLTGKFGEVDRSGGTKQVTYRGRPLYTFAEDTAGQVTGDGVKDAFGGRHFTWHVVTADGVSGSAGGGGSAMGGGYSGY